VALVPLISIVIDRVDLHLQIIFLSVVAVLLSVIPSHSRFTVTRTTGHETEVLLPKIRTDENGYPLEGV